MYVITAHQRYGRTDRQTDVKRSHDRYIAKACSGKKVGYLHERYISACTFFPLRLFVFFFRQLHVESRWMKIDTDLLRIITSTADELPGGYQHRWPWTQKYGFYVIFGYFRLRRALSEFSLKYTADRPRQPAYEIKLMLSRISWALAQISCFSMQNVQNCPAGRGGGLPHWWEN